MSKVPNSQGYDLWSKTYDVYPNPTVAADELHFPQFWRHLKGRRILEIGCGTGRHTAKLKGNQMTALDVSAGMLEVARDKFELDAPTFIHADFMTWSPLGKYDVVLAALVLEHLENLEAFFVKASGILFTGGEVYISEIHPSRSAKGATAHFKYGDSGDEVHLTSFVHESAAVRAAAESAGFKVKANQTIFGDNRLAELNPKWSRFLDQPMIEIWVFEKI